MGNAFSARTNLSAKQQLSLSLLFHFLKVTGYFYQVPKLVASKRMRSRVWTFLKTYALFALFSSILIFNVARTLPAMSTFSGLDTDSVVSVAYFLAWTENTIVFVLNYIGFHPKLHRLVSCFRLYEDSFGYSFDSEGFNRTLKRIIAFIYMFVILGSSVSFIPMVIYFPKFRKQIEPFEHTEGITFVVVCVAFLFLFCIVLFTVLANMFTFGALTFLVRKEFLAIASKASDILCRVQTKKTEPSIGSNADHVSRMHCMDDYNSIPVVKKRSSVTTQEVIPATFDTNTTETPQCSSEVSLSMSASTSGKSLGLPSARDEHSEAFTSSTVGSMVGTVVKDVQDMDGEGSSVIKIQTRDSSLRDNLESEPVTCESLEFPENLDLEHSLETTFDCLRERHEVVCEMVDRIQQCFVHLVPMTYSFAITSLCFVLFTMANGSLPPGRLMAIASVVVMHVSKIVALTAFGCSVHDAVSIETITRTACQSLSVCLSLSACLSFSLIRVRFVKKKSRFALKSCILV